MNAQNAKTEKSAVDEADDKLVGVPDHPVAAGVGAVVLGGATGAAVASVAGPVGTVVGAVAGAVAGALGGDAVASSVEQVGDEHAGDEHVVVEDHEVIGPRTSWEDRQD